MDITKIVKYGSYATAVSALIGLWISLGFPTLATSADIDNLTREQAETAIEVYSGKIRSLILQGGVLAQQPESQFVNEQKQILQHELNLAKRQLDRAIDRKIELGKTK